MSTNINTNTNANVIFAALAAQGIKSVVVRYEGYGDSGSNESIEFDPVQELKPVKVAYKATENKYEDGKWVQIETTQEVMLQKAIDHLAYEVTEEHNGGYENNEGGGGEIVFDVVDRKICHEHYINVVQQEYSSNTIDLASE